MEYDIQADVDAVARIPAVPTILEVICRMTGMGFAAVARVTETRWIACSVRDEIAFGLKPGGELKLETTICSEIRANREPVVIDHVETDPAFRDHNTPAMYGFQSYISMPIILPDGSMFGTLCALDPKPARLQNSETRGMFKLFADLIAFHLDTHLRLAAAEQLLLTEREGSELREQFIAVLGHDLRNPLAAMEAGTRLLRKTPLDGQALSIVAQMQSSALRMSQLIDNVLDFARGRLGGGFHLQRNAAVDLTPLLSQVAAELAAASPGRRIETDFAPCGGVACDPVRIGQLFSNLLGNALAHGSAETPVRARAATDGETFELSVSNAGEPIPAEAMKKLFQPFFRASVRESQQGLGLGLFIAHEIAKAHQGTLSVASSPLETTFTFRMPLHAGA